MCGACLFFSAGLEKNVLKTDNRKLRKQGYNIMELKKYKKSERFPEKAAL